MKTLVLGWILLGFSWAVLFHSRHPLRYTCSAILAFGSLLIFIGPLLFR